MSARCVCLVRGEKTIRTFCDCESVHAPPTCAAGAVIDDHAVHCRQSCLPLLTSTMSGGLVCCGAGAFGGGYERDAEVLWVVVRITAWICVAGWLHKIGWYWAL